MTMMTQEEISKHLNSLKEFSFKPLTEHQQQLFDGVIKSGYMKHIKENKNWLTRKLYLESLKSGDYFVGNASISDAFNSLLLDCANIRHLHSFKNTVNPITTQFVDVSCINFFEDEYQEFYDKITDIKEIDSKTRETVEIGGLDTLVDYIECTIPLDSIELPYKECFYKCCLEYVDKENENAEHEIGSIFVYMKELSPVHFEGIITQELLPNTYYPYSFSIKLEQGNFVYRSYTPFFDGIESEYKDECRLTNALSHLLLVLAKLNKLNHKANVYRYRGETPKQKYKFNGKKEFARKTVYLYLSGNQEIPIGYTRSNMIREISWEVRGHWRRLHNPNSIGVNQQGKRDSKDKDCHGQTWINSYWCGDGKNKQPRTLIVKEKKN